MKRSIASSNRTETRSVPMVLDRFFGSNEESTDEDAGNGDPESAQPTGEQGSGELLPVVSSNGGERSGLPAPNHVPDRGRLSRRSTISSVARRRGSVDRRSLPRRSRRGRSQDRSFAKCSKPRPTAHGRRSGSNTPRIPRAVFARRRCASTPCFVTSGSRYDRLRENDPASEHDGSVGLRRSRLHLL